MIKHIVMFRLKGQDDPQKKHEIVNELISIFSPLKNLEYVREYKTGSNFSKSVNGWDFVIDSVFDNRENLESYQLSAEHITAIDKASRYDKEKAVVDYEY
jgi:hypothetical protein